MTLTPEAGPTHSTPPSGEAEWNVVPIPGSDSEQQERVPFLATVPRPDYENMSDDEALAELTVRDDIPEREKTAAIAYQKMVEEREARVEALVDRRGIDWHTAERQVDPLPPGTTPKELLQRHEAFRRLEEIKTQHLQDKLEEIMNTARSREERLRRINELAAKHRATETVESRHIPNYQYSRPAIFDYYENL